LSIEAIRRERKPVMYWGSWLDAGTAEAALARFRSAPEAPAEVWITGNDHGNRVSADPFETADSPPRPTIDEQYALMRSFAERTQRADAIGRVINYYVLGAGVYRQTDVWPPAGLTQRTLYLNRDNALAARAGREGVLRHNVDLSVGTGERTRWATQIGTPPAYADRAEIDRRLLVFDSAPMVADMELVGTPVINLRVAARTADPAFFVYLEDVAPDGRVTYITEGMLRAIHRRPADPSTLPYDAGPAPHSFRRADAMPVTPGEVMQVRFALFPTAALVRAGHRLRIAIAGADASVFHVYSDGGPEAFDLHMGGAAPSTLDITMRPWTP
jgi:putative CocE/NonD family hydrolase